MEAPPLSPIPRFDESLCIEAAQRADGATAHEVANLITVYRNCIAAARDGTGGDPRLMATTGAEAERQLRIIVARARREQIRIMLTSGPEEAFA